MGTGAFFGSTALIASRQNGSSIALTHENYSITVKFTQSESREWEWGGSEAGRTLHTGLTATVGHRLIEVKRTGEKNFILPSSVHPAFVPAFIVF